MWTQGDLFPSTEIPGVLPTLSSLIIQVNYGFLYKKPLIKTLIEIYTEYISISKYRI